MVFSPNEILVGGAANDLTGSIGGTAQFCVVQAGFLQSDGDGCSEPIDLRYGQRGSRAAWQVQLWRLLASTTCFAAALGLLRFAALHVPVEETFLFIVCLVASVFLLVASVGVLFRRARLWMLYLGVIILRWIAS